MSVPARDPPADRDRHRLFVTNPARWPAWPFLPVVRRTTGAEELGVLFDALGACELPGYSTIVFRCNLFDLPPTLDQFLALPKEVFDASEDLLQAGWRVD